MMSASSSSRLSRYREIFGIFLKLGVFGFGGPIATMAMMEEETSRKRNWVTQERFSEIYSVCKVLPGPASTQMAVYLGTIRTDRFGGFLAGFLFVFPSFLLVLAFAYFYAILGSSRDQWLTFAAMQAGALAVIAISTEQLSRPYRRDLRALLIALISAVVIWMRPGLEPLVILTFGLAGAYWASKKSGGSGKSASLLLPLSAALAGASRVARAASSHLPALQNLADESQWRLLAQLFWTCFKAGAFVFGTGLAIVPLLEGDFVRNLGWLSHAEFMNALAVGQITPGPVVITVTFIGYKVAGLLGAVIATAGIFLAPFINILFIVPRIWDRLSKKPAAKGFSTWAMPAVIGGIIGTTIKLALGTLTSPLLVGLFVASMLVSWRFRISAWKTIPVCGLLGLAFDLLR